MFRMAQALLAVLVPAATSATGIPTPPSTLVRLAAYPNAVCLDGSPAGFYFRKGHGDGAARWYIHHEGGGWCQMETPVQSWPNDNCAARAASRLGTLKGDNSTAVWYASLQKQSSCRGTAPR